MVMASPMSYGGPITLGPPQHVSPVSFHPNHVIGVNGFIAYPNAVFPRPLYAQDAVMRQQMFKYGMQPQQFIAPPPSPMVYQSFVNGHQRRSSMQHHKSPKNPYNKAGVNSHKGLLTVQSAAALSELESCQTAMARQDSKSDVRPPARETQVNV
ncbi:hypothetical protein AB6A40_005632 [Gnathostoma spinigerum]|uniref:Uncharacterized protein n=1 Tax=Gnathostoma spinigerum TaxID=75299 RepID=A0ABD6EG12_9BILA